MAQRLKCLPAMRETWVRSLGGEDPLEKEMATHTPVFLPGESYGRRSLAGYSPRGPKELDTTERLHFQLKSYSGFKTSEITPFEAKRMGLEMIILSQTKTNIIWYHMISLICGI